MSKTRIHELAKELNVTTKQVIDSATALGYEVKNHMSALDEPEIKQIKGKFMKKASDSTVTTNETTTTKPATTSAATEAKPAAEKHHKIIYDRTKEIREEENRLRNKSTDNRNKPYNNQNRTDSRPSYGEKKPYQGNKTYDHAKPVEGAAPSKPAEQKPYENRTPDRKPYENRTSERKPYENRTGSDTRPPRTGHSPNYKGNKPFDPNKPYDPTKRPERTGDGSSRPPYDPNRSSRPPYDPNRPQRPYEPRTGGTGDNRGQRPPYNSRPQQTGPDGKPVYNKEGGGYKGNRPAGQTGGRPYTPGGGYNKDRDSSSGPSYGGKKTDSSSKSAFSTSDIQEKTPKKKKTKKIVATFETDKLEAKSKKAKKLLKEEIIVSEVNPRRNFDFGKRTKQKSGKYKEKTEKEKSEKLDEILLKEVIYVPSEMTVKEFAEIINKSPNDIIVKLMAFGNMATLNKIIDFESAALVALDYDITLEVEEVEAEDHAEEFELNLPDDPKDLKKRAPVVTVMGHVDHGKTSLLDAIRNTGVADGEAGGITQHIGASEIMHKGEKILFLDTPGHEAFTSLRARGAQVTDIAILVVAADDGVMPQTIEAIDHSKAANVPIIVAINKMDKPNANPDRVKQELSDRGVLIEEWGGDVIAVPVSAKTGEGLDKLLEMVLLVSEVLELKANPNRLGIGTVIEAKVVKGRGTVATIILEKGTMRVGDPVVAGTTHGKVKALYNDKGKKVKQIGPSTTVEIDGLNEMTQAGEKIYVTPDEKTARIIAERQAVAFREKALNKNPGVTLEDIFSRIKDGGLKELNIIIKADVHGSVEAIKQSLLKLSNEEVRVNIIRADVGAISESDVILASASSAIIIGFNVRPSTNVSMTAEQEGVDIRTYQIIYNAINDVETAMKGMLDPIYKEVVLGRAQVRATFKIPTGVIAGAYVTTGKIARNAQVRVIRDGIVIFEGKLNSLKRFKDDAKEVATGFECGMGIEKFNDLKEMDEIEAFIMEEVKR